MKPFSSPEECYTLFRRVLFAGSASHGKSSGKYYNMLDSLSITLDELSPLPGHIPTPGWSHRLVGSPGVCPAQVVDIICIHLPIDRQPDSKSAREPRRVAAWQPWRKLLSSKTYSKLAVAERDKTSRPSSCGERPETITRARAHTLHPRVEPMTMCTSLADVLACFLLPTSMMDAVIC